MCGRQFAPSFKVFDGIRDNLPEAMQLGSKKLCEAVNAGYRRIQLTTKPKGIGDHDIVADPDILIAANGMGALAAASGKPLATGTMSWEW